MLLLWKILNIEKKYFNIACQYLDIMDEYLLFEYLLFNIHFSPCNVDHIRPRLIFISIIFLFLLTYFVLNKQYNQT